MKVNVVFSESNHSFDADFGEVHNISDGGYERGYEAGYGVGNTDGYTKGHSDGVTEGYADGHSDGVTEGYADGHSDGYKEGHDDGLAERTYETWTITLDDGTVIEKEVALL